MKSIMDNFIDIGTVLVAAIAAFYAYKTYKVAKEAKDEWKIQKDLEFYIRFSRVLPKANDYIKALRKPHSTSTEISDKFIKQYIKGGIVDEIGLRNHHQELVIASRRDRNLDSIKEITLIYYESMMYVNDDHPIREFLKLVIDTDVEIYRKSGLLSINKEFLSKNNLHPSQHEHLITENEQIMNLIERRENDSISNQIEILHRKCVSELESIKRKTTHNYKKR